jgi:hypothetical protein
VGITAGAVLHSKIDEATPLQVDTHVIVMTDGSDTSSSANIGQVTELLKKCNRIRNFKIKFVGTTLDDEGKVAMLQVGQAVACSTAAPTLLAANISGHADGLGW